MYEMLSEERKARIEFVLAHRQKDLTIILENVYDPHNVAAVMRTCDSIGIQEIFIVNTLDKKAVNYDSQNFRSSRSAHKWLTIHQFDNVKDCMDKVALNYENIFCTHLGETSKDLYEVNFTQKTTAIVFGNEQKGISEEMLHYSTGNFIIPQYGMIKSLNISVACAVTLYEAFRQKEMAGDYQRINFPEDKKEILRTQWSARTPK